MKKALHPAILVSLVALLGVALAGVYLTRGGTDHVARRKAERAAQSNAASLVDTQPLETAQKLAPLAASPEERDFAADALLIADHEVEMCFAYALRQVAAHPPPLTAETRELAAHIKILEPQVKAKQAETERLKQLAAAAPEDKKEAAQEQFDLAQTELELLQDELEDAHQDLIRAGGDPQAEIQRKLDQHEASHQRKDASPAAGAGALAEQSSSASAIARFLAWREIDDKLKLLLAAQSAAKSRGDELAARHESLEAELRADQSGKTAPQQQETVNAPAAPAASSHAAALAHLQRKKSIQTGMAAIDKRVQDFRELETIYGDWGALVSNRRRAFLNGLLWSGVWILLIGMATLLADPVLQRLFARLAPDRTRLHTLRTVIHFAVRAAGVILILLVVFGPPNQLATIIAFAGAGLTVALKSFIVGFFGWFVLMGRNGIRPGDWVEINGIGGEVLEVGLLHTVLLETGSWSDAGHPTGRKVTFVNSFAIEGHYFNFSTSGQWLWDELQVVVPGDADPYATADAIQKMAAAETRENARLAEQEWQRAVEGRIPGAAGGLAPGGAGRGALEKTSRAFSAEPAMSLRPSAGGVNVLVRYITRVHERHEVRARLYRQVVELLHRKQIAQNVS